MSSTTNGVYIGTNGINISGCFKVSSSGAVNIQPLASNPFYIGSWSARHTSIDQYGNIIMDKGCIYIPRGGWRDANDNYYSVTPEDGKLGPLNIFFNTSVESTSYNIEMQRKLNNLLK